MAQPPIETLNYRGYQIERRAQHEVNVRRLSDPSRRLWEGKTVEEAKQWIDAAEGGESE